MNKRRSPPLPYKSHLKLHIKNFWRFLNRQQKFFLALGIVFASILFTLGLFLFVLGNAALIRGLIEAQIQKKFIVQLQEMQEALPEVKEKEESRLGVQEADKPTPAERLVGSSFTDLFSGVGWLDQEATTLYRNNITTAFTFPPNFEWKKVNSSDSQFIELQGDGSDIRCIQSRCLRQIGPKIYFQNNEIKLPEEIPQKSLVNISIGALDSFWLLGVVYKMDKQYEGKVFTFDGLDFYPVEDVKFSSVYEGTIGFGGKEGDWVAIYGAYDGASYHVKGSETHDISRFFGTRVMSGGFHPAILRKGDNGPWYVFSLTEDRPKLLKLFRNENGEIDGSFDFTPQVFGGDMKFISFALSRDPQKLAAKIKTSSEEEYWEFLDKGFNKTKTAEVVSVNINNYPAEIRIARINDLDFSESGARVELFISNDGINWHRARVKEDIIFPDKSGRILRWRAVFVPDSDLETSPFFDRLRLDYQVKFL